MGKSCKSKESEDVWEGNRFGLWGGHSTSFCFLDQSSLEGVAGGALCLALLTPSLTWEPTCQLGMGVVRRTRLEGRTWVDCFVSALPQGVPAGPRVGFKGWEPIFRVPVPYLTPTQGIPSTCNVKTSLHFSTLCWILSNPGVQDRRNSDHSWVQALGINNITSAEWIEQINTNIIQCLSKQRIWLHLLHLVFRYTRSITFYTCRREQLVSVLPYH